MWGRPDSARAEWFDGPTITADDEDNTILAGTLANQAALHGMLTKVRDVGLTLLSLTSSKGQQAQAG